MSDTEQGVQWDNKGATNYKNVYELCAGSSYAALSTEFKNRAVAMELGCGDGVNTERIVQDFTETYVVDASEEFLDLARKRVGVDDPSVHYIATNFEDFDPPLQVDAIFMMHILEHVADPVSILKKYQRYLRPGIGRIFISVPNAQSLHRQLGVAMGLLERPDDLNDQDRFLGHRRVYDQVLLRDHLSAAGLTYTRLQGSFLKLLSAGQMADWDWTVLAGLDKLGKLYPGLSADLCVAAWPPRAPAPSQPVSTFPNF
jgi:trans-aconitate methyltransferase